MSEIVVPERCDPEIVRDGISLFYTHGIDPADLEAWVRKIAQESGQRVDWGFSCGRAVVSCIGDTDAVWTSIYEHLDELMECQRRRFESFKFDHRQWKPDYTILDLA